MGCAEEEFRERDNQIADLLLSDHACDRERGLRLLDAAFRRRVPRHVRPLAWSNPVYRALLSGDGEKYIWHATLASVWTNVIQGKFRRRGSLFSYLRLIYMRRLVDERRRQRKHDAGTDAEWHALAAASNQSEIHETILLFIDGLKEENQVAMRIEFRLAEANDFSWESPEEFRRVLNLERQQRGWPDKSLYAVKKWRSRIRQDLRAFVEKRGFHV